MKNLQFILGFICVMMLIFNQGVYAGKPMTDADLAKLPAYCKARCGPDKQEYEKWSKRIGGNFIHLHHYCGGLNILNHSWGLTDKDARDRSLRVAIQEFQYMQRMASKEFYLQPEIANKAGNTYLRLGNIPEAMNQFSKGITLNPKYVLNYVGLSKVYKKHGEMEKAKEVLEQGLMHNPSSKLLKKRLKRLEK